MGQWVRSLGAFAAIVTGAALSAAAQTASAGPRTWVLSTDDTQLTLALEDRGLVITELRHSGEKWNWIAEPDPVPLPAIVVSKDKPAARWELDRASEDNSAGREVTLRFTCAAPAMELRSVWRANKGPGPVENWVIVENKSDSAITFAGNTPAAVLKLAADAPLTLHYADKTAVGTGRVYEPVIEPHASIRTGRDQIPLVFLRAGDTHGAYLGFEWELGGLSISAGDDPLRFTASATPVTQNVTRAPGAEFLVPSVYYGAYAGDVDDGSNRFKRWFWNNKVPRSLHDHPDEPWVEVCMEPIGGHGSSGVTGSTPQSLYDRLASAGAECAKMDFWDGTGKGWYTDRDWQFHPPAWPNGFDFAAKAHKAGMKASLYMGGTYRDVDLSTIAGRDQELSAVLTCYDQGWFDVWRTDRYTAPEDPIPDTYEGVANFLFIQDHLIHTRPGYRYENCANGGRYKGFAICRRMTFCTMNDDGEHVWPTRSTYYSNTFAINPVQLKSDVGPCSTAYDLRTDMLGAILTWATDNPVYREHIALYKSRQRPILRGGNVYHILPMADGVNWDGLEFYNPDIAKGSVFLFKPSTKATDGDSKVIRLKGLDRSAAYKLTFEDRHELDCQKTGTELMDQGIRVSGMSGNEASEIIWIEKVAGATPAGK